MDPDPSSNHAATFTGPVLYFKAVGKDFKYYVKVRKYYLPLGERKDATKCFPEGSSFFFFNQRVVS